MPAPLLARCLQAQLWATVACTWHGKAAVRQHSQHGHVLNEGLYCSSRWIGPCTRLCSRLVSNADMVVRWALPWEHTVLPEGYPLLEDQHRAHTTYIRGHVHLTDNSTLRQHYATAACAATG
jgi:hypothetical protein